VYLTGIEAPHIDAEYQNCLNFASLQIEQPCAGFPLDYPSVYIIYAYNIGLVPTEVLVVHQTANNALVHHRLERPWSLGFNTLHVALFERFS
jgi:hypothetical protein